MKYYENPLRGQGLPKTATGIDKFISNDVDAVAALIEACPVAKETPLVNIKPLAESLGIGELYFKDERGRMGLGSFKSLGAAYAIAKAAVAANGGKIGTPSEMATALNGSVFIAASAGNHGLSLAAGARVFGARAVVYLSQTVPDEFADRLRGYGADVVIEGDDYEASMAAAVKASEDNGWALLSDSTWPGYDGGRDVMEGYLVMPAEVNKQMEDVPTHIFLQAGVGGLAAAVTVQARAMWGDVPQICVVEPEAAPALINSVIARKPVHAGGPVSNMGRLDCKEPSIIALDCLAKDADAFMTLSDEYVTDAISKLLPYDMETSPSGGAGFAGLMAAVENNEMNLGPDARVLIFVSEGRADE